MSTLTHLPFPRRGGSSRGAGLLELVVALALLALVAGVAGQGLTTLRDRWAVTGARNALAQLVREARGRAVARGGSRVLLSATRHEAVLESGTNVLRTLALQGEFGVRLDLGGAADATLIFDPAGVGRMASRTVTLVRKSATDRIVVSAYGRIR